jgi:hypothetical protein
VLVCVLGTIDFRPGAFTRFAEKKNEIITGFISCLQLVALASKPLVVYQEIKFTKWFENVS